MTTIGAQKIKPASQESHTPMDILRKAQEGSRSVHNNTQEFSQKVPHHSRNFSESPNVSPEKSQ